MNELAKDLGFDYTLAPEVDESVPEDVIFCCRRIIRSALQKMIKTLKESFPESVVVVEKDAGRCAPGLDILQGVSNIPPMDDIRMWRFFQALNTMIKSYDDLYDGSQALLDCRRHLQAKDSV